VTAAVPDPRFRDQLAEALYAVNWCNSNYPGTPGCDCLDAHRRRQADALMPTIAAEVEARVQAAANQRAAEELHRAYIEDGTTVAKLSPVERLTCRIVKVEDLLPRIAALASPATAPQTGGAEDEFQEPPALAEQVRDLIREVRRLRAAQAGSGQ
jgi:hypothetical protein